jgi:hypothetical protein
MTTAEQLVWLKRASGKGNKDTFPRVPFDQMAILQLDQARKMQLG